MSYPFVTRRRILRSLTLLSLAAPLLQACGGGAQPTTAPAAAPTTAPAAQPTTAAAGQATVAPAGQATTAPAAKATTGAAAQPTAAVVTAEKVSLSIATYSGPSNEWQRVYAKKWADQNPNVDLKIEEVLYSEMGKKQLAMLASGTMQDIVFSGIKWFPYSVFKGAFRPIDDFVKSKNPGLDDFFPSTLAGSSFEGKLYGLPYLLENGNLAISVFNKDMAEAKGVKIPTDDWNVTEYVDTARKLTDTSMKVYGTDYMIGTYYDFASLSRTWGTDILSSDGKKFMLATDPKNVEAARWLTDLRTTHKVAPLRAEAANQDPAVMFASGQLASTHTSTAGILSLLEKVGNKFKYQEVLFPKGPGGQRGYHTFTEPFSIYAKSKQPEKAYDLIVYETSTEAGIYAVTESLYQPTARKSVWAAPEIKRINPIFDRALAWMNSVEGPFPHPYNLRFQELQDKWNNTTLPLFFGEVPFEEGIKKVQEECQAIMDQPRG